MDISDIEGTKSLSRIASIQKDIRGKAFEISNEKQDPNFPVPAQFKTMDYDIVTGSPPRKLNHSVSKNEQVRIGRAYQFNEEITLRNRRGKSTLNIRD